MSVSISEKELQVIEAAEALITEGIMWPTNSQVRERIGGGSLSYISPIMKAWRDDRKKAALEKADIPSGVKSVMEAFLGSIWGAAKNEAEKEFIAEKTQLQDDLDALINEKELIEEKLKLSQVSEEAEKEKNNFLESEIENLNSTIDTARTMEQRQLQEINALKVSVQSLNEIKAHYESQFNVLNETIQDKEQENIALHERLLTSESEKTKLSIQLNEEKSRLETDLKTLLNEKESIKEKLELSQSLEKTEKEKNAFLESEIQKLNKTIDKSQALEQVQLEKINSLQVLLESLNKIHASYEAQFKVFNETIKTKESEAAALHERLLTSESEKTKLKTQLEVISPKN